MKVLNFELTWLINEYLSPTVDSELFLLNKFVRMSVGPFVRAMFLDDNELLMTKSSAVTDTIIFEVDMKLRPTTVWWWSCSVKKNRNKKTTKKSQLLNGVKVKNLKYVCINFKLNWYYTARGIFYLSGCLKLVYAIAFRHNSKKIWCHIWIYYLLTIYSYSCSLKDRIDIHP